MYLSNIAIFVSQEHRSNNGFKCKSQLLKIIDQSVKTDILKHQLENCDK